MQVTPEARQIADALDLDPGHLAGIFRREAARKARALSVDLYRDEPGDWERELEKVRDLCLLADGFEAEWERQADDDEADATRWIREEEEKTAATPSEATSVVAAAREEDTSDGADPR